MAIIAPEVKDAVRKKMLTTREAALEIGVSPRTMETWRRVRNPDGSRKGPPWTEIEGQVRYPRREIEAWLSERTAGNEDDFVA